MGEKRLASVAMHGSAAGGQIGALVSKQSLAAVRELRASMAKLHSVPGEVARGIGEEAALCARKGSSGRWWRSRARRQERRLQAASNPWRGM